MKKIVFIYLCFLFSFFVVGQENDSLKTADELSVSDDLGLEELMNVKLTVASHKELSIEQTPAIVSVLTKEDIQRSASKDFTDVLRLIPGFEFTADVNSEIGIGVRGITATEGKVLVMIDGLQMNENLYGTSSWIGRFDINQIEKVEIIRGPGNAAYNGFASLGVINIITKKAADIQGVEAHLTYSRLAKSLGRQQLSVTSGWKKNNWGIKGSVYTGELYRSEGTFTDLEGQSIVMNANKANYVKPFQAYFVANYKKLELKYFHDNYSTTTPFHVGDLLLKPGMSNFQTRILDLSHTLSLGKKFTLKPRINYIYSRPYLANGYTDSTITDPNYFVFDYDNYRFNASLSGQYMISKLISVNVGMGYFHDKAEKHLKSYDANATNSDSLLAIYHDFYDYVELLHQTEKHTISLGYRHEKHNVYGDVFLPRFAATKQYKKWNFKAAYSHAFRAPLAENIMLNPLIKAEITKVAEFQIGYKPFNFMFCSINIFDNHISNPIVYDVVNDKDGYFNFSKLGTRGVESEVLFNFHKFSANATYSYYFKTENDIPKYQANYSSKLVGFAPHKFSFSGKYKIHKQLDFASSLIILGRRCAYTHLNSFGEAAQSELGITTTWNATLSWKNIANKGFSLQLGVFDILNGGYVYAQAYNGGKAPFRATGREVSLKVSYAFSNNK